MVLFQPLAVFCDTVEKMFSFFFVIRAGSDFRNDGHEGAFHFGIRQFMGLMTSTVFVSGLVDSGESALAVFAMGDEITIAIAVSHSA